MNPLAIVRLLRPQIAGDLLDLDHDELGRLERGEADLDVHDAQVAVVLRSSSRRRT